MEISIPIMIGVFIYVLMMAATRSTIRDDMFTLSSYDNKEYPKCAENYFYRNKDTFANICSMIWPLYHIYKIGTMTGRQVYKTITKNDENRFVTWFF